jgi:integrase
MKRAALVTIKKVNHREYNRILVWWRGGQRHRRYYTVTNKTEEKALKALADEKEIELINEGRRHGEWTEAEKAAVLLSREMAEQYASQGVTDFSIETALRYFAAHLEARRVSIPALKAYDEFHATKVREKRSLRYLQDVEGRLKKFATAMEKKLVAEITEADVECYLSGLKVGGVTVANHHRLISVFLSWSVDRGYASLNTAARYNPPTVTADEPGILSVTQVQNLLNAAPVEIVAPLAIAFFAGLRSAEIARLDWRNVDVEHGSITVTAKNAKTRRRRVVAMPYNLKQWLAFHSRAEGPVAPSAQIWRDRLEVARTAAKIGHWPHNAARHSCASYAYDMHQNAPLVAAQLGHDVAVLETHYKGLVKPGEGVKYFAITPAAKPFGNIISMKEAVA